MNIIQRYQPALSWVNEFDRLFDRNLLNPGLTAGPREAIHESENSWIVRVDLPGFGKEDIALTVTDRVLLLNAETPADRPFGGKFERQWRLGNDVDSSSVSARLENGVLELTLPKKAAVQAKRITVQ